ncbi:MAG: hypothetical protein AAGF73_18010, partial [Actinomycetota bacterium]
MEDGEWITLGGWSDENGGWSLRENCPSGTVRDGWAGTYEPYDTYLGRDRFQAVGGEHYVLIGLCAAYLETLPGSFAVGEMPRDIGPPFGVEYEAELTSSEGWVQSNSLDGTLR